MRAKTFSRAIVGFDFRRKESLPRVFLTSYNEKIRYEDLMEKHEAELSPINMFAVDPSTIKSINLPPDGCIVAFDMPTDYLNNISEGNVSNPPSFPISQLDASWRFLGYDIVDPRTQSSALNDFNILEFPESLSALNEFGLINSPDIALKGAAYFDIKIPEHKPFVPCGVWLKD